MAARESILKKNILVICIFSFLLFSCDTNSPREIPLFGNFWAIDFANNNKFYRIDADLIYSGDNCNIWAEKGRGISREKAKEIADEYEIMYSKLVNKFSKQDFMYAGRTFPELTKFADWLGNNDGKICILLLDIKDNYKEGVNDAYIAGYFNPNDLLNNYYSNKRDMIYIDVFPGINNMKELYNTLAHELQHLMNFASSYISRQSGNSVYLLDTWVDEGLASAAEFVYSGEHSENRIHHYEEDRTGLLKRGNNFFVWNSRKNEHINAVLDDYSTVYLFFHWLRLQAEADNNNDIFKNIIYSNNTNHSAVVNAVTGYSDWGTLLRDWMAANFIGSPTGRHGYHNDDRLNKLKINYAPAGITSFQLLPGEGIYSSLTGSFTPVDTGNLRYISLSSSGINSIFSAASGNTLLTFNINTNIKDSAEIGAATGSVPAVNIVPLNAGLLPSSSGAYRIDAGDLLNGDKIIFVP